MAARRVCRTKTIPTQAAIGANAAPPKHPLAATFLRASRSVRSPIAPKSERHTGSDLIKSLPPSNSTYTGICNGGFTMVARRSRSQTAWRANMAATLKGLRRLRNVRSPEMAARLHLSLRAYENFENGRGRLNVERIVRVATLLKADPYAILTALEIESPEFAQRTANNKLISILMLAIRDFDSKAQDAIVGLDPLFLMKAFSSFFDQLAEHAAEQQDVIDRWRRLRDGTDDEGSSGS